MCKSVSIKSAVPKSAVDGTKKCGRGTQKKSYPVISGDSKIEIQKKYLKILHYL
jgi:hypothetical protein